MRLSELAETLQRLDTLTGPIPASRIDRTATLARAIEPGALNDFKGDAINGQH